MLTYVLSSTGKPLMPTRRSGHVRKLLDEKKAKVVKMKPFTIRLRYKSTEYTQPLYGGTDPGRTNIGEAVINENGETRYQAHVQTRNKEIPDLMEDRAAHRRASRQGERKRRQRRAIANGTVTSPVEKERILPGCKEPIVNKYIKNTEARFNNRKRPAGWLTPTTNQLVQTHLCMVRKICSILPVTDWTLEINKFAFMQLENGEVFGADFQNGKMKGYESTKEFITAQQKGKCAFCGRPIEHYHHIVPRSKGGSDRPDNLIGVCEHCHKRIHTEKDSEMQDMLNKRGECKKFNALSVLNQALPYIYQGLEDIFGEDHVHACDGWETEETYTRYGIPKTHSNDAVCIAAIGAECKPQLSSDMPYEIRQFRRHNRKIINAQRERTYKLNGKTVAKNRKPRFEQKDPSLAEYIESCPPECRHQILSSLQVIPSKRYYNTKERDLPGTVFYFQGHRYVKSGQSSGGSSLRAVGAGKRDFPARQCRIIRSGGLVYI